MIMKGCVGIGHGPILLRPSIVANATWTVSCSPTPVLKDRAKLIQPLRGENAGRSKRSPQLILLGILDPIIAVTFFHEILSIPLRGELKPDLSLTSWLTQARFRRCEQRFVVVVR